MNREFDDDDDDDDKSFWVSCGNHELSDGLYEVRSNIMHAKP